MAAQLCELAPREWRRYYEPMVGGAAMFFAMRPVGAVLADTNAELVNFYSVLKSSPRALLQNLSKLKASCDTYYLLRAARPRSPLRRAVRFAYLNRLAWNGLYRVNRSGVFNVPIGDRLPENMWDPASLTEASFALQTAELVHGDFRETAVLAQPNDFVFFDPPYPRGALDSAWFNRYAAAFFTPDDHCDLASLVKVLTSKSVMVMLTLAAVPELDRLYPSWLRRTRVASKSLIACNGKNRRQVCELILRNY